jgi:hypothetical protein
MMIISRRDFFGFSAGASAAFGAAFVAICLPQVRHAFYVRCHY